MTEPSEAGQGMSIIVRTTAGWLETPILVYGIYTVLYGHLGPGGGFAGGVMIATGLTLRTLAHGDSGRDSARAGARVLTSAGALLFLATACLGAVQAGTFLENVLPTPVARHFTLLSGGLIPVYEIGIALLVAGGLFGAFQAFGAIQRTFAPVGDDPEAT